MYDVIVIGAGGVGSATLWRLAQRGARVLGIDQFHPPHDRGSSHGQSRLIRKAYFEHPDYVPLVLRAYELWRELERESGRLLFHATGLVEIGPADGVVVPGVIASCQRHGLLIERFSPEEAMRNFPGLLIPADQQVVFEPEAGYLEVENCVEAALSGARARGATILPDEPVTQWRADGTGYRVTTTRGEYSGDRIVCASGAWSTCWMSDLGVPLTVLRKTLHWFATEGDAYRVQDGFPAFLVESGEQLFYGFPVVDVLGLKAAEHTGGLPVPDPATLDRAEQAEDSRAVGSFLSDWLPWATKRRTRFQACMYTMSPDGHFVVDRHPSHPGVFFAAGLSGHGFKFASVFGEILADLALSGRTRHPIDFLSLSRFRR